MYAGGDGGGIVFVYTALASNILPHGKCIHFNLTLFMSAFTLKQQNIRIRLMLTQTVFMSCHTFDLIIQIIHSHLS